MQCSVPIQLVSERIEINCTTFWCAVGLHQNVETSVKVNHCHFIYNSNQTHCLLKRCKPNPPAAFTGNQIQTQPYFSYAAKYHHIVLICLDAALIKI